MKIFLKILLTILILFLIVVAGFVFTFNPNDYKDDIVNLVKDKTGRTLSIPGDISLSLFPWIGLELGKVTISNAKGFPQHPFAKIEHLQVRVKLLPLLKKELEADTMVVEGLILNLAKDKKGVSNWSDLANKETEPQAKAKTDPATESNNNPGKLLAAFALNGISIKDAQVNWHDAQNNQKLRVNKIQLEIGKLRPDTRVPFSTAFHFLDKSTNAQITFSSKLVFPADFKKLTLHDTTLNSKLKLASLSQQTLSPALNSNLMTLDLENERFTTNNATLSEGDIKLTAKITATHLFSLAKFNTQLVLHNLNPKSLAQRFSIALPAMADQKALTNLRAEITAQGTTNNIVLPQLLLTLDNTRISGNASSQLVSGHSTLNMKVDNINIDRYLPTPEPASESSAKKEQTVNNEEAALIPLALLHAFNVDADLKINQLQIKNTHWSDVHLKAQSKNGLIQINPFNMHGYNADVKSAFTINAKQKTPLLSGNIALQNMQIGKLLKDFMATDKIKGQTSLSANFSTQGLTILDFKKHLNGNVKLKLSDGTLKGFDIEHQQKVLQAKIKQQAAPSAPKNAETKIANLSASAVINKGILTNKDLRAATPLSRIIGQGTVDLVQESIRYVASVKLTNSTDINAAAIFEKMNAIPLDVHINGKFDNLQFKADFQKALNMLIQKELKKHEKKLNDKLQNEIKQQQQELKRKEQELKDKLKQDAQKELDQKIGDKLKNLLNF